MEADKQKFRTREEARSEIFDFIEGYYNTYRRHSGLRLPNLGMQSPAKFELRWFLAQQPELVTK
jgi:transposase InsO family protein